MKSQVLAALAVIIVLTVCCVNVGNASPQASVTLQSNGKISGTTQQENSPSNFTVILRNIDITAGPPPGSGDTQDIYNWVASFVGNHSYANAITISNMEDYGIWFYGYSFSKTNGTWGADNLDNPGAWTFNQLEALINSFHSFGWRVGLECTGIAYAGSTMYNYITELHPELAMTNANGILMTGIDNASAGTGDPGYNCVIPDPFAVFATSDPVNNITAGTRLIDLYTTRLTQMIKDGLSWDFWFGTDGWNGFNLQGYSWDSTNPAGCYSFSLEEINEWAATQGITSSTMLNTALGSTYNSGNENGLGTGYKEATVYQCYADGTISTLSAYLGGSGDVELAVYNGNSTTPETLLGYTNSVSVSGTELYNFTLGSSINIVNGDDYWLSVMTDGNINPFNNGAVGTDTMVTSTNTFSSGFSSSFGSLIAGNNPNQYLSIYAPYNMTVSWGNMATTQQAGYIISTQLSSWSNHWEARFAEMYAQIKQAFINAGESPNTFHIIGSADMSSVPDNGGNLGPAGMYDWQDFAQYNSLDYVYVDQESTQGTGSTYSLGHNQAYAAAAVKMQNPSLNPIIGLQPVNWLGNPYPLWEVEQEYLSQAVNYVWYNGTRYQVSAPNVIMLQYPNDTGWAGWTNTAMNALFSFINSTIASLQNATPAWLGPTCVMPDGTDNNALLSMNFSCAQWTWTDNYANNLYNPSMEALITDSTIPWSGTAESINSQMYPACNCPITSSESLIDLKIYSSNGNFIIPMTDQYDVGDSFTIPSSISTTLTINTTALGLTQPAQDYSVYWESNPHTLIPLSSSGSISVTLSGGAGMLVLTPDPDHFIFSTMGAQTAGTSFTVTITAVNSSGNTVISYTGTPFLTASAGSITPSSATGGFSNGVWTGSVTLTKAGSSVTLGVDDGSGHTGMSNPFTVTHATVANVMISPAGSSVTAGATKTYSATATDAYGNTWDVTSLTSWIISSGAGGSWSSNVYTSANPGSWTITGAYASTAYTTGLTVNPTITASAGAGGAISPTGEVSVNYGGSQGFIITPNTGYYIVDVSVNGSSVGAVSSYTFTNVKAEYAISATFAPTATPTASPSSSPAETSSPAQQSNLNIIIVAVAVILVLAVLSVIIRRSASFKGFKATLKRLNRFSG